MKKIKRTLCIFMASLTCLTGMPDMVLSVQAATAKAVTQKSTAQKNTKKKNGWYVEGTFRRYYYENGKKVIGRWKTIKGDRYFFGNSGTAFVGPGRVNGKMYLFREDAKLCRRKKDGFVKVRGKYYYAYKTGELRIGWFRYGGSIYYADSMGRIAKNTRRDGVIFNKDGKARVTPRTQMHVYAQAILNSVTTSSMTNVQKLRACYNYLAYSGQFYYYAPADPNLSANYWYITCANKMFGQHRGNCYGFSCAFAALAKEIGYQPYMMCARVPGTRDQAADGYTRHCWVMINGGHYDPEGSFAGWGGCFGSKYFTTPYKQLNKVKFN